jgi:hypothetical protein
MKEYKEIEPAVGAGLILTVLSLIKKTYDTGELYCAKFNGQMLYSDTVSLDSAYLAVTGETFSELMETKRKGRENYEKQERELKAAIPDLVAKWREKGRMILSSNKWNLWDKCVPIRLGDLYHGMELGYTLEIAEILNKGGSFEDAKKAMENQNHSGMSWGLVKSMVRSFCDKGEEFTGWLE